MADKGNDPAVVWQTMIAEMEKGFNSFANQAMASPEFSKVMNQAGGAAVGAQKQLGEMMEKYLVRHEPAEPGAIRRPGRAAAINRGPAQRDQGDAQPDEPRLRRGPRWSCRHAAAAAHQTSAFREGEPK